MRATRSGSNPSQRSSKSTSRSSTISTIRTSEQHDRYRDCGSPLRARPWTCFAGYFFSNAGLVAGRRRLRCAWLRFLIETGAPTHDLVDCLIMSGILQVFGRRHDKPFHALRRPASKKRECTKSREVWHRLGSGRYEDSMAASLSMVSVTRARGDVQGLHTGEPRRVRWASRRAREVRQRTAGELIDEYCCERRQPGRTHHNLRVTA
jgi:hypothetical protein